MKQADKKKISKNRRLEQHSQQLDLIDNDGILHSTTGTDTMSRRRVLWAQAAFTKTVFSSIK